MGSAPTHVFRRGAGVFAQYTMMKRQYAAQERAATPKAQGMER